MSGDDGHSGPKEGFETTNVDGRGGVSPPLSAGARPPSPYADLSPPADMDPVSTDLRLEEDVLFSPAAYGGSQKNSPANPPLIAPRPQRPLPSSSILGAVDPYAHEGYESPDSPKPGSQALREGREASFLPSGSPTFVGLNRSSGGGDVYRGPQTPTLRVDEGNHLNSSSEDPRHDYEGSPSHQPSDNHDLSLPSGSASGSAVVDTYPSNPVSHLEQNVSSTLEIGHRPLPPMPLPKTPQNVGSLQEPSSDQPPARKPTKKSKWDLDTDPSPGKSTSPPKPRRFNADIRSLIPSQGTRKARQRFRIESPSPPPASASQAPSIPYLQVHPTLTESNAQGEDDQTPTAPKKPPFPDPDTPTLKAYKIEPPRIGPGFDGRPIRQPHPNAHNRSHLFIRPHRLPDEEMQAISNLYIELFSITNETRNSLLPRQYRYPPTRDEAARLRKLDFERRTGESMPDDAYYALFDLETSTDGMLSALLEWMQGRTWVKVPFVNRIIHQIGRLMYTSAQEEARLRIRRRMECDFLKRKLDDFEKRFAEERRAAGLDVNDERAAGIRRIRDVWKRVGDMLNKEDDVIHQNMERWKDAQLVATKVSVSFNAWKELNSQFIGALDDRQQLEDVIEGGDQIFLEDLGQLQQLDANIEQLYHNFHAWRLQRAEEIIDWVRIDDAGAFDTIDLLKDVHSGLGVEERLLDNALLDVKRIADLQHEARLTRAKSLVDTVGDQRQPTIPNLGHDITCSFAGLDSSEKTAPSRIPPSESSGSGLRELPSQHGVHQSGDADSQSDSTGRQALEQQLNDLKKELGERNRQVKSIVQERDEARKALDLVQNGDIEAALGHINSYRDLVHTEMYESLQYLNQMLESQVHRVEEQAFLLEQPLKFLQNGGPPGTILEDLQSMTQSVRRMGEATLLIQDQLTEHLDEMKNHCKTRFGYIEKEHALEKERRESLIKSLRKQIEDLESHIQQHFENDAKRNLRLVRMLEQQMKAKTDKLREKIRAYKSMLKKQREQSQADADANGDNQVAITLGQKDEELTRRELRCKQLEEQAQKADEEFATLRKAATDSDKAVRDLEDQVSELQLQLEERDEGDRWTLWDRSAINAVDSSDPDNQHMAKVVQLRKELLAAIVKTESEEVKKIRRRDSLPRFVKSVLLPKKQQTAQKCEPTSSGGRKSSETAEKDLMTFWRLATFQRKRGDVVAALRHGKWERALTLLDELHGWDQKMPPWQSELHRIEVYRSLNYLRAYINMKIGSAERLAGKTNRSSERLGHAKTCFEAAEEAYGEDGPHGSWKSLRDHLEIELGKTDDQQNICECKYKALPCRKHQDDDKVLYHNFMEVKEGGRVEIELTQEASDLLQPHGSRQL